MTLLWVGTPLRSHFQGPAFVAILAQGLATFVVPISPTHPQPFEGFPVFDLFVGFLELSGWGLGPTGPGRHVSAGRGTDFELSL